MEVAMSLYQRGKSWYYDFKYRGERYTGCIGAVSKTVAKEILAKKKAEAVEGRYELPSKKPSPLFEAVADEYLRYYRVNRAPKSVRRHEMAYRAIRPLFEGKRLSDITPFLLERYKRARKEAGLSPVTINRELAFLKNLFTMAIAWGKASENPVKAVKTFREDNGRIRFLTEEEESRLLPLCGPYLKPLVITALHTGFRKSELLSLRWENVDFRHRLIRVEAGYAKNREVRSVPMNELLTQTLQDSTLNESTGPVFRNRQGQPYRDPDNAFATAVRRAGITDFTFHDLRHTFASRLVMAGVDLATVKELMGHKHIAMTLRYAHLTPGHKRAAVEVLSGGAGKGPSNFHNTQVIEKSGTIVTA
jgi:integrase